MDPRRAESTLWVNEKKTKKNPGRSAGWKEREHSCTKRKSVGSVEKGSLLENLFQRATNLSLEA